MTDDIEDALEAANEAFISPAANPETGLEHVEDAELLLRKGCRLRTALLELAAVNGYYTLAIEVSFAIIERSMEYYVASRGREPDTSSHTATFSEAATTGLITDEQADQSEQLWGRYRNENYYDTGMATERRAEAMQMLAGVVHDRSVELTQGAERICTCE